MCLCVCGCVCVCACECLGGHACMCVCWCICCVCVCVRAHTFGHVCMHACVCVCVCEVLGKKGVVWSHQHLEHMSAWLKAVVRLNKTRIWFGADICIDAACAAKSTGMHCETGRQRSLCAAMRRSFAWWHWYTTTGTWKMWCDETGKYCLSSLCGQKFDWHILYMYHFVFWFLWKAEVTKYECVNIVDSWLLPVPQRKTPDLSWNLEKMKQMQEGQVD